MHEHDDLETAAAPNVMVKLAAASFALAALFTALTGVQVLEIEWRDDWMNAGRYVFLGLGVVLFALALRTFRGDVRANLAGIGVAGLGGLAAVVWFIATFGRLLSPMNVLAGATCGLAVALGAVGLRHTRRMAAAKAKLAAEGLSLGT